MSVGVKTPQCFPRALKFGDWEFPAPEANHEHCPVGQHTPGLMGGWHCECPCHQKTHHSAHSTESTTEAHDTPGHIRRETNENLVHEVLKALCENANISTRSPWAPTEPAPSFVLAQRLGIGRVFNVPDQEVSEEKPSTVGKWSVLVAGESVGWDQTALGVALYAPNGELAFFRWEGLEKAVLRGDWPRHWGEMEITPPPTWEAMEKTHGRIGNTVSQLRWEGVGVTLSSSEETFERIYNDVVRKPLIPTVQKVDLDPAVAQQ